MLEFRFAFLDECLHAFLLILGRKARIYASFGIREVWVINAGTLVTRTHSKPGLDGYADVREIAPASALALPFALEISVALGDLDLR